MKLTKLFALAAAMMLAPGAWGQTQNVSMGDITYLVTNPKFDGNEGWTFINEGEDYSGTSSDTWSNDGTGYATCRWVDHGPKQTIMNLPAGTYKLVMAVRGTAATATQKLFIKWGDGADQIAESDVLEGNSEGNGNKAVEGSYEINKNGIEMPYSRTQKDMFPSATYAHQWHWASVTAVVPTSGNITIGSTFISRNAGLNHVDDVHLYYMGDGEKEYCVTLNEDAANDINGKVVTCDIKVSSTEPAFSLADIVIGDDNNLYPLNESVSFTTNKVSFTRSFTAGQTSTLCLPVSLTSAQLTAAGLEAYEFSGFDGTVLSFTQVDAIEAGKPYVVKKMTAGALPEISGPIEISTTLTDKEINGLIFKGSFAKRSLVSDDAKTYYGYAASNGAFAKAGTNNGATIKPFRAYFEMPAAEAPAEVRMQLIGFAGDATAISTIGTDMQPAAIYDLQGRKVAKAQKGIYIVNGKKIMY